MLEFVDLMCTIRIASSGYALSITRSTNLHFISWVSVPATMHIDMELHLINLRMFSHFSSN